MPTLTERILADGITSTVVEIGSNPALGGWPHRNYAVALHRGSAKMAVNGGMAVGLAVDEPTTVDVMESLISNATHIEATTSYQEWASEFETDSSRWPSRDTYEANVTMTANLRTFLGEERFQDYLHNTEH